MISQINPKPSWLRSRMRDDALLTGDTNLDDLERDAVDEPIDSAAPGFELPADEVLLPPPEEMVDGADNARHVSGPLQQRPSAAAFEKLANPITPTQRQAPSVDAAQGDMRDIESGRDRDSLAGMVRGIEMAGKQFNSAVGGIPMAGMVSPDSTSFEKNALARATAAESRRFSRSQAEIANAHRNAMEARSARNDAAALSERERVATRQGENDKIKNERDAVGADFRERQLKSQEGRSEKHNQTIERAAHVAAGNKDWERTAGIPYGYELKPDARPTTGQREDMTELIVTADSMNGSIDELEDLLRSPKIDLLNKYSAERMRMAQLIQQIGTSVRVAENLGVPSHADTRITKDLQGDPESAIGIVLNRGPGAIAEMRRYSRGKVTAKLNYLGITEKAGSGHSGAKSPARHGGKIRVSNGKETLEIDPKDEAEAKASGYGRVK